MLAAPGLDAGQEMSHHLHHSGHTQHGGFSLWLAMLLAMAPLVLRSEVAYLWRSNLPRLRWPAVGAFLWAHLLPWLVLGIAWTMIAASSSLSGPVLLILLGGVIVWHCAPLRQRCLNRCHRLPQLRAFGRGMLGDTAAFGIRTGALCCAICGPSMILAMAIPSHHLAAMVAVTAIATIGRYLPARRPAWQLPRPFARREPHWRSLFIPPALPKIA